MTNNTQKAPPRPVRAVLYLREANVSASATTEGIARQQEACEALAAERGWSVENVFTDTNWTSSGTRPGYQAMLAAVDAGEVDAIVTLSLDRLTRKVTDFEALLQRHEATGLRVAAVEATEHQEIVKGLIMNEWERDRVAARRARSRSASQRRAR